MTRSTTTTSLAVIGASALVHLRVPQTVAAFVRAKAQGSDFVPPDGAPTLARFGAFAGGFAGLSLILIASEGSPTLAEPMSALAVLVATTGVIVAWDDWTQLLHIPKAQPTPANAAAAAQGVGETGISAGAAAIAAGQPATAASWSSGTTVPVPQLGSIV